MNFYGSKEHAPIFHILSEMKKKELHLATLQILERTGVAFECQEAIDLLVDAGADASDHDRIKIPSDMVEQALITAPKIITLYSRDGEPAIVLNGMNGSHFGATPNLRGILDPFTGKRRNCYVDDIADQSRLIDALPNIEWCWNAESDLNLPVGPKGEMSGRVSLLQILLNSSKPIFAENASLSSLKEMLEICAIVVGGEEQLRERPFFGSSSEPVSPLIQGKDALEKSLFCAEKGIPNIIYSMPMAGATAPATFAGCLAIANAEILSQLVVVQLKNPGAPVIIGAIPSIMDMQTTIFSYGAPELSLMVGALTELCHYYNLPMFGTAGCTDAEKVGIQATAEVTYQVMITALTGADLIHDVTCMYHGNMGSPELTVLVNEIIGMVNVLLGGIEINDETVPLSLIERLGPRATFLAEKHTAKHFKKFWVPQIFDRSFIKTAEDKDCEQKLRDKTVQIIKTHMPKPLPPEIVRELKIIEATWLNQMGLNEYPKKERPNN